MKAVDSAIQAGRCALAVSGSLLRDPDVLLALKDRAALTPMALSGPAVSPVSQINDRGIARAVAAPNGVLVLVEPELSDTQGVGSLAKLLSRAGNKPKVFVVARSFNPFAFGSLGVPVEHIKGKGKNFLRDLPLPPTDMAKVEVTLEKKSKAKKGGLAPRFVFVGRDEELKTLTEMLQTVGPIVVSGPHGIGKRSLVEQALATTELKRMPELTIGRGTGFDTLVARLAYICKDGGAPQLFDAAKNPESKPSDIIAAAVESLAAVDTDAVMLIEGTHTALGRQADFFRKSRLEMLLLALLTRPSKLRLVFTSLDQPVFFREGEGQHTRRLPLEGLKGRFLYEIFEAYKAPEFPRDRMGAISEKIGGHPLAARTYAIEVRERPDGLKLTEDAKFFKLEGSLEKVKRTLRKRVDKLSEADRKSLASVAHYAAPIDGATLAKLGINRNTRITLNGFGLLDMTGTETDRKYRVHPLVRAQLTWRETSDFDVYRAIADTAWAGLKDATGLNKLVLEQTMNQACSGSRQHRRRLHTELPDTDHSVDSVIGMIRSRKPNFQMARERLKGIVTAQPGNSDAHILLLELIQTEERGPRPDRNEKGGRKRQEKGPRQKPKNLSQEFTAAADAAMEHAPVPEVFHRIAGYWLSRRKRGKAIEALQKAVEVLPQEARLRCRLGALLLREGRRVEAVALYREAMELEPMLPDAYGLLGMAKQDEGIQAIAEAETLLREAVRLAPSDPVQTARLAALLIDKAVAESDVGARSDVFAEAKELLETSLQGEQKAPEAQLLLAQLHRRSGGDLERAEWLLKQAKKNSDRKAERQHRIALERSMLMLARGELDEAEALVRAQAARVPSSHRAFATLASILEARQQYIPAHAEYIRASERAPQGSLWAQSYAQELQRIQALIEAQAAGLIPQSPVESAPEVVRSEATGNTAHRVIRRPKAATGSDPESTPVEAAEADETPSEPVGTGVESDPESSEPDAEAGVQPTE